MKYIEIERLKTFINKISEKKERIEINYFNTLNIFNDVLKSTTNEETLVEISNRKNKLDTATNAAISTLDDVERKLKNALNEIERDIESGNWDDFDKAREIANDIDRAVNINPVDVLNNRLEYVKELRDTVEYGGGISDAWKNSDIYEFESVSQEFHDNRDNINDNFYDSPADVKAGLLNDEQYAFEDKLNSLERKLDREIEKLTIQGNTLESHKDAILSAIHKLEKKAMNDNQLFSMSQANNNAFNTELYFSSLDKSVSNAVEKLDAVSERMTSAIAILSSEQVSNLEKISIPLIKSLETTLSTLTSDVTTLKKENIDYRRQLEDCKKIIENLSQNNKEKEMELDSSYKSWLESTRKLNDLEEVLLEQSREIQILDDDKNQIIDDLERKIMDASDYLTQAIHEKEMLIRENEELVATIKRIEKDKQDQNNSSFDDYINSVSIQDLIEKEANKIVETKISSFVDKYQDEIERINSNLISSINYQNAQPENHENYVFDDLIDENEKNYFDQLEQTITRFDKKIKNLEEQLKQKENIQEKTKESLSDLNEFIETKTYSSLSNENLTEKEYLSEKFNLLEQKIEESLKKVTELENSNNDKSSKKKENYSEQELNELFMTSPLYGAIKNELHNMEREVNDLRFENEKIAEENFVMNSVIDETLKKLTINSSKMKEIEDLLTKQEYEYMILNDEKDNVIQKLYETIKNNDMSKIENLQMTTSLEKYDFNDFAKKTINDVQNVDSENIMNYIKSEVEKIVNDELKFLKYKYDKELSDINDKYKEEHHEENNEINKIQSLEVEKNDFKGSNLLGEEEIIEELVEKQVNQDKKELLHESYEYSQNPKVDLIDDLDVTLLNPNNAWETNIKPIINYTSNKEINDEIRSLNNKNIELERRIEELQNLINAKANEQMNSYNHTVIKEEVVYNNENKDLYENLKENQEQHLKEIDNKLEVSLEMIKNDQLAKLNEINKKIDNMRFDANENFGTTFDKQIMSESNQNKYLEKEIIESTDKLLKLQNLLLNLEKEITKEEKKVITNL